MSAPSTTSTLDARYGRTPARRRRSIVIAVLVAVVIAVTFTVWAIWAGPGQTSHGLDTEDVGYQVIDDTTTVVRTQVSVDTGTPVDCAVQALDKAFTIVGWKVVRIPASDQETRTISTTLRTSQRGVTGLINKCWIP